MDFFVNGVNKVFIISGGRTGTLFFAKNLSQIIPKCRSIHEPDNIPPKFNELLLDGIRRQGIYDLFIGKALGTSGARNLSIQYLAGKRSKEKVLKSFYNSRKWVKDCDLYVESNAQLFGIGNVLLEIPKSKIVVFVRDPRTWVRSWMIKGYWYDEKDTMERYNFLGWKRLTPDNIGINCPGWSNFTRFQKLCWAWNNINSRLVALHKEHLENVCLYKYEDIFVKKDVEIMGKLLKDIAGEDFDIKGYPEKLLERLKVRLNQNKQNSFSEWYDWNKEDCQILHDSCKDTMYELGYGIEEDWKQRVEI